MRHCATLAVARAWQVYYSPPSKFELLQRVLWSELEKCTIHHRLKFERMHPCVTQMLQHKAEKIERTQVIALVF